MKPIYIHKENEPKLKELNSNFENATNDLKEIHNSIKEIAKSCESLIGNSELFSNESISKIKQLQEKQNDINLFLNNYNNFDNVIILDDEKLSGDYSIVNKTITAKQKQSSKVKYEIINLTGNGYEGNEYVYSIKNKKYKKEIIDTSKRKAIQDEDDYTFYEYSRLYTNNPNVNVPSINHDYNNVKCTLTLNSKDYFNTLVLKSENEDLTITSIKVSNDNIEYHDVISSPIKIDAFNCQSSLDKDGVVSFNSSKYIKIVLESSMISTDIIANGKEDIKTYSDVFRRVIKINTIQLLSNEYEESSIFQTEALIDVPAKAIAIYSEEYYPTNCFGAEIKYIAILNGIEHEIDPINITSSNTQIIKNSEYDSQLSNVQYTNSLIKDAIIKVYIKVPKKSNTAFIKNLKLLIKR